MDSGRTIGQGGDITVEYTLKVRIPPSIAGADLNGLSSLLSGFPGSPGSTNRHLPVSSPQPILPEPPRRIALPPSSEPFRLAPAGYVPPDWDRVPPIQERPALARVPQGATPQPTPRRSASTYWHQLLALLMQKEVWQLSVIALVIGIAIALGIYKDRLVAIVNKDEAPKADVIEAPPEAVAEPAAAAEPEAENTQEAGAVPSSIIELFKEK